MSTTPDTTTFEPIPGREVEGEIVDELPRSDTPHPMLRVDVNGSTWRVPAEECHR